MRLFSSFAPKNPPLHLLPTVFRKYPQIQAVYLFGSIARGKAHEESDLDLAVLPCGKSTPQLKLDLLTDLARHGFCHVDLVFLDVNNIVLKYEAVRHNQVTYQVEGFDRGEVYSRIIRQYLDFLPYLEVQPQAYKRRVLGGQGDVLQRD